MTWSVGGMQYTVSFWLDISVFVPKISGMGSVSGEPSSAWIAAMRYTRRYSICDSPHW